MKGQLEKNLVVSCRNGDRSAYAGLVKAYSGRVFAICLGMLGHRDDAKDIAQQALLKGFTDIKRLRDDGHFGAWISRITKNLCIDFIRRRKREQSILAKRACVGRNGFNEYSEYSGLKNALKELSEEYRLTIMLYYFDGRSTKNIAETLMISEAAAQTRLSRARKQLRKLLEAEGGA